VGEGGGSGELTYEHRKNRNVGVKLDGFRFRDEVRVRLGDCVSSVLHERGPVVRRVCVIARSGFGWGRADAHSCRLLAGGSHDRWVAICVQSSVWGGLLQVLEYSIFSTTKRVQFRPRNGVNAVHVGCLGCGGCMRDLARARVVCDVWWWGMRVCGCWEAGCVRCEPGEGEGTDLRPRREVEL
jgi:hypothetical protein